VPALVRWPGLVKPHTEINDIVSAEDWVQTLVSVAGEPDVQNKLLHGYNAGGKSFKVHLDGYDQRDLLAGKGPDKRREFFYWTDDGNFAGLRYDQYKAVFMEQPAHGLEVWMQPLVPLRAPKLFNLRADPFERAEQEAGDYDKWFIGICLSWFRLRQSWRSTSQPSKSSHLGRSQGASRLTGQWTY
jgi:arylsulfatase A-like enzyme